MQVDESEKVDLEAEPQSAPDKHHNREMLLIAGGIPTLASLLGFLGSMWWGFDLLANFRVQYVIILLVAVIACLALKRWKIALLFLLPTALNFATILPLYKHPQGLNPLATDKALLAKTDSTNSSSYTPKKPGEPIGILNMHVPETEESRTHLRNYIRDLTVDVVILHEFDEAMKLTIQNQVAPFDLRWSNPREDEFGTAVLLRVSMRPSVLFKREDVSIHEFSDGRQRIPATVVRVGWADRKFLILAVDLAGPFSAESAELGNKQVESIVTWVSQQTLPVVVVGNFGTTPWTARFERLLTRTNLKNSQLGFGISATWPAGGGLPIGELPFDHLLHSDDFVTIKRELGPSLGASHRPLGVALQWHDDFNDMTITPEDNKSEAAPAETADEEAGSNLEKENKPKPASGEKKQ